MPSRRDVLAAVGAAGLLGSGAPAAAGDRSTTTPTPGEGGSGGMARPEWPSYRNGPGNTGAVPGADAPRREPPTAWAASVAGTAAPALAGDLVITGGEAVVAFDAETGEHRWVHEPDAPAPGQPVVSGSVVVVGTDEGVEAVDAATGDPLWGATLGDRVGTVAVDGDLVFADVRDGPVVALNRLEGEVRWQYVSDDDPTRPPVVHDDTVFLGGETVVALDAVTGERRWQAEPPGAEVTLGPLAYGAGRVFGAGADGSGGAVVAAYDAETGQQAWTTTVDAGMDGAVGDPVAVGDEVLVGAGGLRVFEAGGGEQVWRREVTPAGGVTPAVAGGLAVQREGRTLLTGRELPGGGLVWRVDLDEQLASPPVVGRERVYVVDEDRTLHALGGAVETERPPPEERPRFGYDWVDSWAPAAGALGAPYVLGPLVLGGLLAASERLARWRGRDDE